METEGDSLSKLDEKEIFKILQHTLVGDTKDHKIRRIKHLTELRRRIKSNSIQDINSLIISLLEIAKKHGDKPLEFPMHACSIRVLPNFIVLTSVVRD